jgi:hypothetical protein
MPRVIIRKQDGFEELKRREKLRKKYVYTDSKG